MSRRTRRFRARRGFACPATPDGVRRARAERLRPGDPAVEWERHEAGDLLPEPHPELLASWLANDLVEEVK